MFVSHDRSVTKKKIQKPNILRRKPKAIVLKSTIKSEFLDSLYERDSNTSTYFVESNSNINNEINSRFHSLLPTEISVENSNSYEEELDPLSLNIESFLIDNSLKQNDPLVANITPVARDLGSQVVKTSDKLCLRFIDDSNRLVIEQCDTTQEDFYLEQRSDIISTMVPLSAVSTIQGTLDNNHAPIPTVLKGHVFSIEALTQKSVRYKCDAPNCSKEFLSEQKLLKHKNTHNKECRVPRQTTLECPVKKVDHSGMEQPCGKIFQVRGELLKHLNEEHAPDDAAYICVECDRRFFWASGLRAHSRSHAAATRATLACPWPGCGRVFRQPCRLREHSRAHTGDKPYHCSYPNCGWSFRTASKLLRHSRRHTGDRRHPCGACGRAFLRREHLREHTARHHACRHSHACPVTDCKQTFTNMSSLYTHIKKVHPKEDTNELNDPVTETEHILKKPGNMFMVNLWDGSATLELVEEKKHETQDISMESKTNDVGSELKIEDAVDVVDIEGVGEVEGLPEVEGIREVEEFREVQGGGHSARTHCTWPLSQKSYKSPTDGYTLEDDVQVEQSEGSESNIYTVRSDLFLHGSVFHSEDSEQMGSAARACGERGLAALDADLLLGAPSLDISQEELYTDAVDESSFRVFLLSGEELS